MFGANEQTGEEQVYVGQANIRSDGKGVLRRVQEHLRKIGFVYYTHPIMVIDSENSIGSTELDYLERVFHKQVTDAHRVRTVNKNKPPVSNVSGEKKAELDRFIENAKVLIGSLGYRVFETVDDSKTPTRRDPQTSSPGEEPLLYLNASGASGTGHQVTDGFVVLAGAKLRPEMTPTAPQLAHENRKRFADRINANNELTCKTLFTSPSAASSFLMGRSSSGKTDWKTADGTPLRDLEFQDETEN